MNWYVIYTNLGYEFSLMREISRKNFESFVPEHQVTDKAKGKIKLPLFPRYVFVRTVQERLKEILQIKGAINTVFFQEDFATVSQKEIDLIRAFMKEHAVVLKQKTKVVPVLINDAAQQTSDVSKSSGSVITDVPRLSLPSLGGILIAQDDHVEE